jgi:hypothetical protein
MGDITGRENEDRGENCSVGVNGDTVGDLRYRRGGVKGDVVGERIGSGSIFSYGIAGAKSLGT